MATQTKPLEFLIEGQLRDKDIRRLAKEAAERYADEGWEPDTDFSGSESLQRFDEDRVLCCTTQSRPQFVVPTIDEILRDYWRMREEREARDKQAAEEHPGLAAQASTKFGCFHQLAVIR